MIEVKKLDPNSIEIKKDNQSFNGYNAVFRSAIQGDNVRIFSDTRYYGFDETVLYTNLKINGVVPSSAKDAYDKLSEFIGAAFPFASDPSLSIPNFQDVTSQGASTNLPIIIANATTDFEATTLGQVKVIVKEELDKIVAGAPEALDTLKEIADELANNETAVSIIYNELNNKANKTDIKTINGNSLLGGGNLVIDKNTIGLDKVQNLPLIGNYYNVTTATTQASNGDIISSTYYNSNHTILLPLNPLDSDFVRLVGLKSGTTKLIDGNGKNINIYLIDNTFSTATTLTIDKTVDLTFIFNLNSNSWEVII